MKNRLSIILLIVVVLVSAASQIIYSNVNSIDEKILSYNVDCKKQNLALFWKDNKGAVLGSIQHLKDYVESKK